MKKDLFVAPFRGITGLKPKQDLILNRFTITTTEKFLEEHKDIIDNQVFKDISRLKEFRPEAAVIFSTFRDKEKYGDML